MKVQELLQEATNLPTPPEYHQELEVEVPAKLREIGAKHSLTVRIGGGGLQIKKEFSGRGYAIHLKPRGTGASDRYMDDKRGYATRYHSEKNENYDAFWKEALPYLASKFDISTPNPVSYGSRVGAQELTASSKIESGTNDMMIWCHFKGKKDKSVDKYREKMERDLRTMIVTALMDAYTVSRHADSGKPIDLDKSKLKYAFEHVRHILDNEKEHGREYPEIEKLLKPKTFKDTIKREMLDRHTKELRSALTPKKEYASDKDKSLRPHHLDDAFRNIEHARKQGHDMPELEKILPKEKWKETSRAAWENYLIRELTSTIKRDPEGIADKIHEIKRQVKELERNSGHKFPKLDVILKQKNIPEEFWKLVLKTDSPTTAQVIKYILGEYKNSASSEYYDNARYSKIRTLIDFAKQTGHSGPELAAIQKSIKGAKDDQ